MDKLLIRGGRALHGEVAIAGAKNAALPELCAALLTAQPVRLSNVPLLQDVATMGKLLRHMGAQAERSKTVEVGFRHAGQSAMPSTGFRRGVVWPMPEFRGGASGIESYPRASERLPVIHFHRSSICSESRR